MTNTCIIVKDQNTLIVSYKNITKDDLTRLFTAIPSTNVTGFAYLLITDKINLANLPDFKLALSDSILIHEIKPHMGYDTTYVSNIMSTPYLDVQYYLKNGDILDFNKDYLPFKTDIDYLTVRTSFDEEVKEITIQPNYEFYPMIGRKELLNHTVFANDKVYLLPDRAANNDLFELSSDLVIMLDDNDDDNITYLVFDVRNNKVLYKANKQTDFKQIVLNEQINNEFNNIYQDKVNAARQFKPKISKKHPNQQLNLRFKKSKINKK